MTSMGEIPATMPMIGQRNALIATSPEFVPGHMIQKARASGDGNRPRFVDSKKSTASGEWRPKCNDSHGGEGKEVAVNMEQQAPVIADGSDDGDDAVTVVMNDAATDTHRRVGRAVGIVKRLHDEDGKEESNGDSTTETWTTTSEEKSIEEASEASSVIDEGAWHRSVGAKAGGLAGYSGRSSECKRVNRSDQPTFEVFERVNMRTNSRVAAMSHSHIVLDENRKVPSHA